MANILHIKDYAKYIEDYFCILKLFRMIISNIYMETSVNERLECYLKATNKRAKDFADDIGMNPKTLSNKLNGNREFKIEELTNILLRFEDINPSWLLMGNGDMLRNEEVVECKHNECFNGIPYFKDADMMCGTPSGFNFSLMQDKADGYMVIPELSKVKGAIMVKTNGRSMINRSVPGRSIPEGAWIALQKSNISTIMWGEVYALATADGFIVKKLMPSEQEGYIKCVSFNTEEDYLPFELPCTDIYDFALVVGVINVSLWR